VRRREFIKPAIPMIGVLYGISAAEHRTLCLAENISVNSRTSRRNRSAIPTQMRGGLLHALPVTLLKVARGRTAGG